MNKGIKEQLKDKLQNIDLIDENKNKKIESVLKKLKLSINQVTILKSGRIIPAIIDPFLINFIILVKDNASIRRHVSLKLLEALYENKRVIKDPNTNKIKGRIIFNWDKYTLIDSDNLKQEFTYKSFIFVNAIKEGIIELSKEVNDYIIEFDNYNIG